MPNITLTDEISDILKRSTITPYSVTLPPGQLPPKTYAAVNKVLVNAGGKWNTKTKSHIFPSDPRQKLGLILESGVAIDQKKLLQAFFTPPGLAAWVATMANVHGKIVLEPSAGHGALVTACITSGARAVHCVEIDPECCRVLESKGIPTTQGDFLTQQPQPYERIVMNPPFTKNQDIKHVAHALQFLAPGGVLVAIMSPNVDRAGFQKLIAGRHHHIESIPAGTFKESGTNIATILLRIISR